VQIIYQKYAARPSVPKYWNEYYYWTL